MLINITDKIDYALYGNENNTINVLDIIRRLQKEKKNKLVVNNDTFNYLHNNTDDKYLIMSINNKIHSFEESNEIDIDYDLFKNNFKIIIVRTDRNLYWEDWYKNILKYYKNSKIYVIYNFTLIEKESLPDNIEVIENKKYNKGIFLAYYYILKNKLNGKFLILDDKIIINSIFDNNKVNQTLFTFEHKWKIDNKYIYNLLNALENSEDLYIEYEKFNWLGSFKSMSTISSDFLNKINKNHNLENLINAINNNQYEMAFERIFGILLYYYSNNNKPIYGDIHNELQKNMNPWNFTYDKYIISKKDKYFNYIFK